jgi:hypothetical protein
MSADRRLGLDKSATYRIVVVGHLGRSRLWFDATIFEHSHDADGSAITILGIEVCDQSMLHGLLARIRDLGLPLVSVCRTCGQDSSGGKE